MRRILYDKSMLLRKRRCIQSMSMQQLLDDKHSWCLYDNSVKGVSVSESRNYKRMRLGEYGCI